MRKGGDIEIGGRKREKVIEGKTKRQETCWNLPPEGWFKANFDGASKGNLEISGYGGIIRNSYGEGIAAFSLPLGIQTNHLAEARAAYEAVKLDFDLGFRRIWLEGDSKNIIDCLKCINQPSWTISNIIEGTRAILDKFEGVYVCHVFREANSVADWFANDGVRWNDLMIWKLGRKILEEANNIIDQEKILGITKEINQ